MYCRFRTSALVRFDLRVQVSDEQEGAHKLYESQNKECCEAHNGRITIEIGQLQETLHCAVINIEEETVKVDKYTDWSTTQHRSPPTSTVFSSKLEVSQCNRHEAEDNNKQEKRQY